MLKQQLTLMANTISDLQDKVKSQSLELKQRESEASHSQQENKELRDRLKSKSDVIRKQESLVEQLRIKISDLEKELSNARNDISSLGLKSSTLESQLEDARKLISEKDAVIESNKQVISYLNEEQSKWQLGFIGATANSNTRTPIAAPYEVHDVTPDIPRSTSIKSPVTFEYNPKLSILSKKSMAMPLSSTSLLSTTKQSLPSSKSKDAEVYARGLTNLGLSDKINEFNLDSLDEINLFSSPTTNPKLSDLAYYAPAEKVGAKPSSENTAANVTPTATNANHGKSSGTSAKHYAWESPDWIEATLTAAGVRRA